MITKKEVLSVQNIFGAVVVGFMVDRGLENPDELASLLRQVGYEVSDTEIANILEDPKVAFRPTFFAALTRVLDLSNAEAERMVWGRERDGFALLDEELRRRQRASYRLAPAGRR
jgi:hypothetical protein